MTTFVVNFIKTQNSINSKKLNFQADEKMAY